MVKVEKDALEQIVEESSKISNWMDQSTEDHGLILEGLRTMIITLKAMDLKLNLLKPITKAFPGIPDPKPVYRKASPGFDLGKPDKPLPARRVVEYEKKSGELGYKIVGGDVIFEKQAFKYLQECKYGCGNYISFDNYKKGQKALHITEDLIAIGKYCPKYE